VTVEELATPEPRPGFTVSRIGFTNGSAETGDGGDPFAFDLGPSPFASHSPEEFSPEHQKPGSLDQSSKTPLRGEDDHAASAMPDLTTASATSANTTDSATAARPKEPFAVPSVAATLGPHRTLEPLSAAFQSAPFEHRSFENQSFESPSYEPRSYEQGTYEKGPYEQVSYEQRSHIPQPEVASQSENARNSSVRAEFRGERLERMLQPAPAEEAVPQRLMEDAMADLLRPLLRTWLAENMPKIVERALRREMTERLLPGQKGPFD
jgi:cell pole-organizing protein PopZ